MSTRTRKWAIGIAGVIVVVFIMGQFDFQRMVSGKEPMFARWARYPADGGSAEYPFVGYTVTAMHRIEGVTTEGKRYRVGPKLDYWIPLIGRDATVLMVRTNR